MAALLTQPAGVRVAAAVPARRSARVAAPAAARRASVAAPRRLVCNAAALEVPAEFTKITPMGDRVCVKVAKAETKTAGGILLPTDAQRKPTSGDVVSVGDKAVSLKAGDTVVYSKFGIGVTDLEIKGEEYAVLKEEDIIGTFPSSGATASDVGSLKPLFDRVLVRVAEAKAASKGGVLLPDSAKEKPLVGSVVAVGPGKKDEEMKLAPGDKVVYFKYAGDKMTDDKGTEYVVLHQNDVLGKL